MGVTKAGIVPPFTWYHVKAAQFGLTSHTVSGCLRPLRISGRPERSRVETVEVLRHHSAILYNI